LEGDGTIESGALSFFFLLICFSSHWFLGSMPIAKPTKIRCPTREAHTILVVTRSQGSVISTHSLDRFNWDGYIVTRGTSSNYPTVLAGLPMGTGAEAFLLSTWVIMAMQQWERRAKSLLSGAVWDLFGRVEVFEFEHDPGAVPSGGWWGFYRFMR
jgi:hypothetical protein